MTIKELLKLAQKRKWHITDHGEIRCEDGYCPIIAVHRMKFPRVKYGNALVSEAGKELGLATVTIDSIVLAADNPVHSIESNDIMRARLVKELLGVK
jgi:hypothetical protein